MTWAQRLKRVFSIDIETRSKCGGAVKIIASIEDPTVIRKILAHLGANEIPAATARLPVCRAPTTNEWTNGRSRTSVCFAALGPPDQRSTRADVKRCLISPEFWQYSV